MTDLSEFLLEECECGADKWDVWEDARLPSGEGHVTFICQVCLHRETFTYDDPREALEYDKD